MERREGNWEGEEPERGRKGDGYPLQIPEYATADVHIKSPKKPFDIVHMSTYTRMKNTAVFKTNGIVCRSVRNARFCDINIYSKMSTIQRQFRDRHRSDIEHVRCFRHEVRASIIKCDVIFIRKHEAISSVANSWASSWVGLERANVDPRFLIRS